jgi:hypothetical protein
VVGGADASKRRCAGSLFCNSGSGLFSEGAWAFRCQVPGHGLRFVSGHPLKFRVCQPGFDGRRTLAGKVDFADEGVPVDFDALRYSDDLDLFSAQGSAVGPAPSAQMQDTVGACAANRFALK